MLPNGRLCIRLKSKHTLLFSRLCRWVAILFSRISKEQLHDRIIPVRDFPFAENFLSIRICKCRPPLTDIAGADAEGISEEHHVFGGDGAVVDGEEKIARRKQGDDGRSVVERIDQFWIIRNARLLFRNKVIAIPENNAKNSALQNVNYCVTDFRRTPVRLQIRSL